MKEIKIYNALAGLSSVKKYAGGAWRLFTLAKNLDVAGSGRVAKNELVSACLDFGVSRKSVNRWLNRAVQLGLLSPHKDCLEIISVDNCARILSAEGIARAVILEKPKLLFEEGWRGVVWAGFLKSLDREDKPTARETLECLSGISVREQRILESKIDLITVFQNVSEWNEVSEFKNFDSDKFYVKGGKLYERKANNYVVSYIRLAKKGMLRKRRALYGSSKVRRTYLKTYFQNMKPAIKQATMKEIDCHVFKFHNSGLKMNFWQGIEGLVCA